MAGHAVRVYNLHGRRDNKYKARIKILIHETGIDAFRDQVEHEFATMDRAAVSAPEGEMERIAAYFAPPELAEKPADQREGVCAFAHWQAAQRFSDFPTLRNQNLPLPEVRALYIGIGYGELNLG